MRITTDNYELRIEEAEGELFVHLDIFNWSASVYKQMMRELIEIKKAVSADLFCCISQFENKKIKLVKMFGFFPLYEIDDKYIMRLI